MTAIPQPPGWPLVGNITDIDPNNTWYSLQKLWEKYGDIFKIKVLGQQIVFVGSVALCEELCDETRFRKFVGGPIVEIRYSVHSSLFTAFEDEASWGIHHRLLAPYITKDAIAPHFAQIRQCAGELVEKWKELGSAARGKGAKVSTFGELSRLDLETTTLAFFGRKLGNVTSKDPHPMIAAMEGATGEAMRRPTRPKLLNWLFYQGKFQRDTATMRKYAKDCYDLRKREGDQGRKDLLWAMMQAKDPETGKGLTEQEVIDEVVTMPIGSYTAPCTISTALYYLLKNPDALSRAREEIDAVLPDGKQLEESDLDKLEYCKAIVRETMRLAAPAPGFNIEPKPGTKGPVSLAGGKYTIPPTQTVIIVLHGVNRDPTVYPSPNTFQPDRMLEPAFSALPAGAKKFFGNGKRVCYGTEWAWMWCFAVLVELLRGVELRLADEGYKLVQAGNFSLAPKGFDVLVRGREGVGKGKGERGAEAE